MHTKTTPKLYSTEIITTEEVTYKLDMFQAIFCKNRQIWLVGLGKNFSRCRYKFTSMEFQDKYQTHGVWIRLEALEHQEMNVQVKVTRGTLRTIVNSLMVHARVLEAYTNFTLIYTSDHILPVLPIQY